MPNNRPRIKCGAAVSIFLFLLVWTHRTSAQTLTFGNQKWELSPTYSSYNAQDYVRSNFALADLARSSLLGTDNPDVVRIMDEDTTKQLLDIASSIDQKPENAQLIIDGRKATNFNPGQNGQALDLYELLTLLESGASNIELPVTVSTPPVKLADTNQIGINELVGVGESNFSGSHNNRIVNITVGAAKYDGLIIQPGEEFSFNKNLGDVDAAHGFLPELVIKPEGVVPEFGGGLCQVSTTAFRAAMNSGLPITARRNHSFAVAYYSPQGTDATIYPGASDLKFVNDLPTSILIHTKIIGKKLYFEFYGTKDGRNIAFEGPVQYDKKPDGSMKATWTRHITKDGNTTTQVFKSNYLSPALFHHDAVNQPTTPNPDAPKTP